MVQSNLSSATPPKSWRRWKPDSTSREPEGGGTPITEKVVVEEEEVKAKQKQESAVVDGKRFDDWKLNQ